MKKLLLASTVLLSILSIGACKKKTETKSKTELATQKPWLVSNMEYKINNAPSWTQYPDWTNASACEKDDVIILRANMTYEQNEGATKCNAADPQMIDTGTWAWLENETKINLNGEIGVLEQLDENTMVVTGTEVVSGMTITVRMSLRH